MHRASLGHWVASGSAPGGHYLLNENIGVIFSILRNLYKWRTWW